MNLLRKTVLLAVIVVTALASGVFWGKAVSRSGKDVLSIGVYLGKGGIDIGVGKLPERNAARLIDSLRSSGVSGQVVSLFEVEATSLALINSGTNAFLVEMIADGVTGELFFTAKTPGRSDVKCPLRTGSLRL